MTETAASAPPAPVPSTPTAPVPPRPASVPSSATRRPALPVRGRPARRVVRRIDPVSVLRVSALFYACVFLVVLVAGIVLWLVASGAGIVGNVETFIGDLLALEDFQFEPLQILQASFLGGVVLVALGTGANVLAVMLFNLLADVVGGVELTVVEDDPSTPRSVV